MHAPLFVFEFLGTTELLVIALVALILFGPRKLPEIGRQVGKSIAEFKRASDDFKRTWEFEVEMDQRKTTPESEASAVAPPATTAGELGEATHADAASAAHHEAGGETVARTPSTWRPDGMADESAWDVATGHAPAAAATDAHAGGAETAHAVGAETSQAGAETSQAHARNTSPANEEINAS